MSGNLRAFVFCVFVFISQLVPSVFAEGQLKIIAFGDSTTAPRGQLKVYSQLLSERHHSNKLSIKVINAGKGGNNTNQALLRFHRDVLSKSPDIVIIQFGINDAAVDVWKKPAKKYPRVPQFIFEANLRHFIRMTKQVGATPIIMTPNPLKWTPQLKILYGKPPYHTDSHAGFNVILNKYVALVKQIAQEEQAELVDIYSAFKAKQTDELLSDGMHPNAEGHQLIADLIFPLIINVLKQPSPKPEQISESTGSLDQQGLWLEQRVQKFSTGSLASHGPFLLNSRGAIVSVHHAGFFKSSDEGKSWKRSAISSPQAPILLRPERALIRTQSGSYVLVYLNDASPKAVKWGWDNKSNSPIPETRRDVWVIRSVDQGDTWSAPVCLLKGYCGAVRDIVQMKNGRLVVPLQDLLMKEARHVTVVMCSDDDGMTWLRGTTLDIGGRGHHDGSIEGTLVELKDGRLWMLLRSNLGYFLSTFSTDGKNWTSLKPSRINSSSAPGMLARLQSG